MRVIAGSAKGKRLKAPSGRETRPITDMVKEALFNVLGPGIKDARFLDLFAGSGSVGIEALSRGAAIASSLTTILKQCESSMKTWITAVLAIIMKYTATMFYGR